MTESDKKPPVKRNTAPTSVRLTPGCYEALEELASLYDINRTEAFEIGTRLLLDTLKAAKPPKIKAPEKSPKKPKQAP